MLAGDIHSTWLSELKLDFDRPEQPSGAVEFVATSVSSDFLIAFDAPIKAGTQPADAPTTQPVKESAMEATTQP